MSDNDKISILEKILADNDSIRKVVAKAKASAASFKDPKMRERAAVRSIITHYANRCAITGGATALPSLIPFIGTIYSIFGAASADAIAALKFEVEMALALTDYMGYDIDDPKERKIAIVLACAALEDAFDADKPMTLFQVMQSAASEYSTREFTKSLAKLITRAIFAIASKKWTRFFPIVGIAIGGGMNMIMSMHTGRGCYNAIRRRKRNESK